MPDRALQHPGITAAELWGYPYLPVWPECPVCRGECDYYYLDVNRDIVMCDSDGCFDENRDFDSVVNAWEWEGL